MPIREGTVIPSTPWPMVSVSLLGGLLRAKKQIYKHSVWSIQDSGKSLTRTHKTSTWGTSNQLTVPKCHLISPIRRFHSITTTNRTKNLKIRTEVWHTKLRTKTASRLSNYQSISTRAKKWSLRQENTWILLNTTSIRWLLLMRKGLRVPRIGEVLEEINWWALDKIWGLIRIKCITQQVGSIPLGLEIGSQQEETCNREADSS